MLDAGRWNSPGLPTGDATRNLTWRATAQIMLIMLAETGYAGRGSVQRLHAAPPPARMTCQRTRRDSGPRRRHGKYLKVRASELPGIVARQEQVQEGNKVVSPAKPG